MIIINLLKLFWTFFKIGLFTFGGGYAMIPLIEQEMVNQGYLTIEQVYQFIGISESTPGPFAINIATFTGYQIEGVLGALFATLGVVLPSFIIILIIARLGDMLIQNRVAKNILSFFKPTIIGFIIVAALNVMLKAVFGDMQNFDFSWQALVIFSVITLVSVGFKKLSPLILILLSGILGLLLYMI